MRRVLMSIALLAMPAALLFALPAGSAFAASRPTIVSCKTFAVSAAPGAIAAATGCNHVAISGAGATQTIGTGTFAVTWNSGLTTTGTDTKMVITPSKCPSTFPEEVEAFGTVTGGTATRLIGGHASSLFCSSTLERELFPGTKWHM
jgi:hypothetical protein